MKLKDFRKVERAAGISRAEVARIGTALIFAVGVMIFTGTQFGYIDQVYLLVAAAVIGAYMAMNIGANDVANNVGPAVGSFALTLPMAILIAAVFEAAGAIIAGGEVVSTVKNGIIDPEEIGDPQVFVWVMMGALLGAAIWLNLATWVGAPVSTTHSIVGGVMGAGIASSGWAIVNWPAVGAIVSSWVISPLAGGLIAAGTLYALKRLVLWQDDPVTAAVRFVPYLLGFMAWTFTTYIALKGKGPAAVPCKMGDAHGILNTSGKTLKWLNFAVSTTKGRGDNFDLADNLVGRKLDPIPQFVSAQFKKESLRPNNPAYPGTGVLYRRLLGPDVFSTSWNHVDHVLIPAGSTAGPRKLEGVEEVYYVMKGSGTFSIKSQSAAIKADDAFYGLLGEELTITNNGTGDLELVVIGVAPSTQKDPARLRPLAKPKAMVLQMDFVVTKENAEAFEKMYYSIYVPAMTVQQGYLESKLLRIYPDNVAKTIEAEPTTYNYQIQICFDTEENRRKWVASAQHQIAWPAATALAKEYKWRGYDVMGDDNQNK